MTNFIIALALIVFIILTVLINYAIHHIHFRPPCFDRYQKKEFYRLTQGYHEHFEREQYKETEIKFPAFMKNKFKLREGIKKLFKF